MKLLSIGTVLMLALARTDHADDASLGGRVTDENLVAIASATISARNVFSGEVEYARSDANGLYKLTGLRQGRYSVFAEAEGYGCRWVFNVFLFRGKHTELDLILATCRKAVPSDGCKEWVRSAI
jgi:Carboxypeptidase regulatory-like domain